MYQLPPLAPIEILIYLRKSRADDPLLTVAEVLSKHEEMLDDYCQRTFGELIPEENRFREVVSGETLDSRPEICRVLRLIESPRYKAILVVEPQRLSRGDLEDIGRLSKLLRYTGTIVLTLQYSYDPTDARDRDDLERELKRGNEYLEYTKRIMTNGRILSVKRGNFIGNVAPYGYRKIAIKEDRRTVYTLEPDPAEAPYVLKIFELSAAGMGSTNIAHEIEALGAPTRKNKRWTQASIETILRNPHYLGVVFWGRRKGVTHVKDGELIASRPWADTFLTCEGKHPALISQELWNSVHQRKAALPRLQISKELRNPFAGLVFCSCGHAMTYRTYRKDGKERSVPRLLCTNQTHCHNTSASVEAVTDAVRSALTRNLRTLALRLSAPETQDEEKERHIALLEKRIADLNALEITYWERHISEAMPQHVFEALNEKLKSDRSAAQRALEKAKADLNEPELLKAKHANVNAALLLLDDPAATASQKNDVLRAVIERITYSRPDRTSTPSIEVTFL